jgi:hypothetical protein
MMIVSHDTQNKVVPAESYITDTLNAYINTGQEELVNYTSKGPNPVTFSINKYNYVAAGLSGTYDDFYEYADGQDKFIISFNKEKLCGFCGWINRITNW